MCKSFVPLCVCVCVSPSFRIPLLPVIRAAYKNTNTDKPGPLSFQPEHVIKLAAPVVTAGKKNSSALCMSALLDLCLVPCHQPQESVSGEKNNCMFLLNAAAWIAGCNHRFLFLGQKQAPSFILTICVEFIICAGNVQKMMFQRTPASRPGICSSV